MGKTYLVQLKRPIWLTPYPYDQLCKSECLQPNGVVEVEVIPNPTGMGVDWLMVKNTRMATSLPVWKQHAASLECEGEYGAE